MNHGQVYVREEIHSPTDIVWQLLRDFTDISAFTPSKVVRTEGTGIGMTRHIDGRSGRVIERCEAHDDTAMTFTYRLLESPWSFASVVTVTLTEAGLETTTIEWVSRFETDSEDVEGIRTMIESMYRDRFIPRLRESVARKIQENIGLTEIVVNDCPKN